jgi:predicted outer membrane repeat protein
MARSVFSLSSFSSFLREWGSGGFGHVSSTKEDKMKRTVFTSAVLLASLFICVSGLLGFTITVDCNGGGDYLTMQGGIDAAVDGDTVLVSPCTYLGIGNRDINVGDKTIVIMSTDGPEETIVDAEGAGRGFLFQDDVFAESILDGFTVRNGFATGHGGGIYMYLVRPTITNCIISGNSADRGGGIFADYASPQIIDCTIRDNVAETYGGGIYTTNGSANIDHCLIEGNSTTWNHGGGAYVGWYGGFTGPRVSNCTFRNNSAYYYGGHGGGLYYYKIEPTYQYSYVWGNTFTGNSAYHGSGAYLNDCKISLYNCLFENNGSDYPASYGGAIYLNDCSDALLHNNTLTNNFCGSNGGGIHNYVSNTAIVNSIIYGNEGDPGDEEITHTYYHAPTVTYSNVRGGWTGTGNIDADPLFAEEIDYHLDPGSPCVDAGDPAILDGSLPPGLGGDRSDMGTYGGSDNGELLEGVFDLFLYPTGPTTVTAGDTIFFDALIWNSNDNPATGNFWLTLVLPNQNEVMIPPVILNHWNPMYGTTPAPGTNTIPNELRTILTGTYQVIGRIGVYPNNVVEEESFEIQVN